MNRKDIVNNLGEWTGLRIVVQENRCPTFLLESGANCRFKLSYRDKSILWGTFGAEYWGVWILNNHVNWEINEMPVAPINSTTIEKSKNQDYYVFWSRFFMEALSNESTCFFSKGIWTLTIGYSHENKNKNSVDVIEDIRHAFCKENPKWIDWDIGKYGSLIALKKEPKEESGRLKWFRKLVREGSCPPVLIWYLGCTDGYVIIDGHIRLKAFQLENIPAKLLVINKIIERKVNLKDSKTLHALSKGLEKSKSSREEINKILIAAYDTGPYPYRITNAKARSRFEETWATEVRKMGTLLELNKENIEEMILRIEK